MFAEKKKKMGKKNFFKKKNCLNFQTALRNNLR